LRNCGIYRSLEDDVLIWKDTKGIVPVRVKDIYSNLIRLNTALTSSIFPIIFWKSGCPSKTIYFSWLVFHNKNLSWDNLQKLCWHGPGFCLICNSAEESNCHMFFQCHKTQQLWHALADLYGFPQIAHASTKEAFIWWSGQKESWRPLVIIAPWCTWRWRNNIIFKYIKEPFMGILQSIVSLYNTLPAKSSRRKKSNQKEQTHDHTLLPRAYFDGATQNSSCGCKTHIIMDENLQYKFPGMEGRVQIESRGKGSCGSSNFFPFP